MPLSRAYLFLLVGLDLTVAQAQLLDDPCGEGLRRFREHDYLAARPLLETCLQQDSTRVSTLLALTVIATVQDAGPTAIAYGERLVAAAGDDPEAHYWYGRALLQSGRLSEAQTQWDQGLALSQTHLGILEGLARLAMDRGEDAKAYNLLRQMQLQGADAGWMHGLLSDLARRKGLWDEAAGHWRDMLARDGETASDLITFGELTILAGRPGEAVEIVRRAVKLQASGATWGALGEAFFAADQVDSAVIALRRAVQLTPDEPRIRFNLANALALQGTSPEADENFARYVELEPDDPVGHLDYGVYLERAGRLEPALAQIDSAGQLDPQLLSALMARARLLEKLGRVEEALTAVQELERRDPANQESLARWREQLQGQSTELAAGKVQLQHIVTGDPQAVASLTAELAAGADFSALAMRFSTGPTAAQGGDIGWVDPRSMVQPLREAIEKLGVGETSPLVESKGLYHVFKRVR